MVVVHHTAALGTLLQASLSGHKPETPGATVIGFAQAFGFMFLQDISWFSHRFSLPVALKTWTICISILFVPFFDSFALKSVLLMRTRSTSFFLPPVLNQRHNIVGGKIQLLLGLHTVLLGNVFLG